MIPNPIDQPLQVPIQELHKVYTRALIIIGVVSLIFVIGSLYLGIQIGQHKIASSPLSTTNLGDSTAASSPSETPKPVQTPDSGNCADAPCIYPPAPNLDTKDLQPPVGWKKVSIEEIGVEFYIPSSFSKHGNWNVRKDPGEIGYRLMFLPSKCLSTITDDCKIIPFVVTIPSFDYTVGRGASFMDYSRYVKQTDSVTAFFNQEAIQNNRGQIIPNNLLRLVTNPNGVTFVRIIGNKYHPFNNSEVDIERELEGTPGSGYIGAIINTNNPKYPGINIKMQLTNDSGTEQKESDFDRILSTFKFTK